MFESKTIYVSTHTFLDQNLWQIYRFYTIFTNAKQFLDPPNILGIQQNFGPPQNLDQVSAHASMNDWLMT